MPATARVKAAPNFLDNLEAARAFFTSQDPESAGARFAKPKAELRELVAILSWSPGSGRTARFLTANSAQARLRAKAVQQLAQQANLPLLREYVIGQHIALYAHSEVEVVLLTPKHHRQLICHATE